MGVGLHRCALIACSKRQGHEVEALAARSRQSSSKSTRAAGRATDEAPNSREARTSQFPQFLKFEGSAHPHPAEVLKFEGSARPHSQNILDFEGFPHPPRARSSHPSPLPQPPAINPQPSANAPLPCATSARICTPGPNN